MKTVHTSQHEARLYMAYLKANGIKFTYWHRSVCEHIVTVESAEPATDSAIEPEEYIVGGVILSREEYLREIAC